MQDIDAGRSGAPWFAQCRLKRAALGVRRRHCLCVVPERFPGVGCGVRGDVSRRAGDDQIAAARTALRAEIDHPVGGADHVQVVLDDEQRVAGAK